MSARSDDAERAVVERIVRELISSLVESRGMLPLGYSMGNVLAWAAARAEDELDEDLATLHKHGAELVASDADSALYDLVAWGRFLDIDPSDPRAALGSRLDESLRARCAGCPTKH
jgi:hypothetical protein